MSLRLHYAVRKCACAAKLVIKMSSSREYLSLSGEIDLPFQQLTPENAGSALEERSKTRS